MPRDPSLVERTREALVSMRSDLLSRLDAANVAQRADRRLNEEIETLQTA
jgi:hypothetical protein